MQVGEFEPYDKPSYNNPNDNISLLGDVLSTTGINFNTYTPPKLPQRKAFLKKSLVKEFDKNVIVYPFFSLRTPKV